MIAQVISGLAILTVTATCSLFAQRPQWTQGDAAAITRLALEKVLFEESWPAGRPPLRVDVDTSFRNVAVGLGITENLEKAVSATPRFPFHAATHAETFNCTTLRSSKSCTFRDTVTYAAVSWSTRQGLADSVAVWVVVMWPRQSSTNARQGDRMPPWERETHIAKEVILVRQGKGDWVFARWGAVILP
jgi:hypothetical protein